MAPKFDSPEAPANFSAVLKAERPESKATAASSASTTESEDDTFQDVTGESEGFILVGPESLKKPASPAS
jgi:hypothetical protein